jgi:hypothetical protein
MAEASLEMELGWRMAWRILMMAFWICCPPDQSWFDRYRIAGTRDGSRRTFTRSRDCQHGEYVFHV